MIIFAVMKQNCLPKPCKTDLISLLISDKKDLSPSEEWGVDQQLISKLKEQYKKERKGKKGLQSMDCSCSFLFFISCAHIIKMTEVKCRKTRPYLADPPSKFLLLCFRDMQNFAVVVYPVCFFSFKTITINTLQNCCF